MKKDVLWTVRKVIECEKNGERLDGKLLEEFSRIESLPENQLEPGLREYLRLVHLVTERNLVAALGQVRKTYENAQGDPGLMMYAKWGVIHVSKAMVSMAKSDPGNAEIGVTYKALQEWGEISPEGHILAAKHFLMIGRNEEGSEIIEKIRVTWPNHPLMCGFETEKGGENDGSKH